MPVTMPGSAMGSRISRVTASLPKNLKRYMAAAAKVPSTMAIAMEASATCTESAERRPEIGPCPGDGEPFCGQARRREGIARVIRGEAVEDDEEDRQVEKEHAEPGGGFEAPAGLALGAVRRARGFLERIESSRGVWRWQGRWP